MEKEPSNLRLEAFSTESTAALLCFLPKHAKLDVQQLQKQQGGSTYDNGKPNFGI